MKHLVTAALLCMAAANAATLQVKVENIDSQGGTLRLGLFDQKTWPHDYQPLASAAVQAVAPQTVVTFKDLKPGEYGIKLYQDANNNDEFDQNIIGYPLERYGFSSDAVPHLSQPSFERAKFVVKPGDNIIVIHLQ